MVFSDYARSSLARFLRHLYRELHPGDTWKTLPYCARPDGKLLERKQCSLICKLRLHLRELAKRCTHKRQEQQQLLSAGDVDGGSDRMDAEADSDAVLHALLQTVMLLGTEWKVSAVSLQTWPTWKLNSYINLDFIPM